MSKINTRRQVLNVSNDMFFYLTQAEEPLDPEAFEQELQDIKEEFPYGYEIAEYTANEDGSYDITFYAYTSLQVEEPEDDFEVHYVWALTHKQLQLQIINKERLKYRWFNTDTLSPCSEAEEAEIIDIHGNKAFYTKLGSTFFIKGFTEV